MSEKKLNLPPARAIKDALEPIIGNPAARIAAAENTDRIRWAWIQEDTTKDPFQGWRFRNTAPPVGEWDWRLVKEDVEAPIGKGWVFKNIGSQGTSPGWKWHITKEDLFQPFTKGWGGKWHYVEEDPNKPEEDELELERPRRFRKKWKLKKKYKTTPLYTSDDNIPLEVKVPEPITKGRTWKVYKLLFKTWLKNKSKKLSEKEKGILWRETLEELGGMWIKVGQMMAMRTDLYEKEFTEELAKLQSRVRPFPGDIAVKIIEESLGKPIYAVFSQFDKTPIAAASMAQVHKGRLAYNGQQVAIKVQRPYTEEYLKADLAIIKRLLTRRAKGFSPYKVMYWELEIMLREEIDFRYEITNLKEARKQFRKYKIYVPKVYKHLSDKKMVVMEFIPGVTMSRFIQAKKEDPQRVKFWLKKNKIKPKKVGRKLMRSIWNQLYVDNYFHGDLQPGNIMLLKKNWLVFIDLGSVGSTDLSMLTMHRQMINAFSEKNMTKGVDFFMMQIPDIPIQHYNGIKEALQKGMRASIKKGNLRNVPLKDRTTFHNSSEEMTKELAKYNVPANFGMMKMMRALATVDPTIVNLDHKMDMQKEWSDYYDGEYRRRSKWKVATDFHAFRDTVSDTIDMLLDMERRRAMDGKPTVPNEALFLAFLLQPIKLAVRIAFLFLLWTYLFQKFSFLDAYHEPGNVLTQAVERMPEFGHVLWIVILFVVHKIRSRIGKLKSTVEEPVKKII